jgi:hypothetical protein
MPRKKHNTRKRKSQKISRDIMSMVLLDTLKQINNAKKIPFFDIERPNVGIYKDFLEHFNTVIEVSERQENGNFFVKMDEAKLGIHEVDAHGWYARLTGMEYQQIHIQ